MVGITISIVGFFGSRLVNQVDEMDKSLQTTREVQASQGEIIKGLQRDQDSANKEIERLRDQVDRLKDDNATLKAKAGIPLTLNNEPPSGGFFVSVEGCQLAAFSFSHSRLDGPQPFPVDACAEFALFVRWPLKRYALSLNRWRAKPF
ncbi:conjugal transfer protein TraF [Enterobacter sp. C2]|uniref:conjugal transfer protein TraF n=1 Tax=Enterobacter sp. C2 TaxID=2870346 RepID=UPI001CA3DA56|nr:conjugal transfer protein TraF [Enterobacter sp. C2]